MCTSDPAARRASAGRRSVSIWPLAAAVLLAALALAGCGATATKSTGPPTPKASAAIVLDARDGAAIWGMAADTRLAPASCTKIMTGLLVLEHVKDLGRYATVPEIPLPQTVGVDLVPGDRITVHEALRAMLVKSANDAALTLASYVAGNEPKFVKLMNDRAAQLGMTNTHFVNCRGTPRPDHYSSARDLAVLGREAMKDPRFRAIVKLKTAVIHYPPDHAVPVENHNRLLDYPWADGVKTGSTVVSGRCLVGSGRPGPVPLIVVTLHEATREQEVADQVALFTWASGLYRRVVLATAGTPVATVPVSGGGEVTLVAATSLAAGVRKGAAVTHSVTAPAEFASRPKAGRVVGHVTYTGGGVELGSVKLVAAPATSPSPAP